jgi:hypothetical protein
MHKAHWVHFYQDDNSETMELRKQVDELKAKLSEKDVPPATTVDDQLKLMEKSYQMAAKYLPQNATGNAAPANGTASGAAGANQKEHFVSFTPTRKNTVSALYREPTDSAFLADWSETRNGVFIPQVLLSRWYSLKTVSKPVYTMHKR